MASIHQEAWAEKVSLELHKSTLIISPCFVCRLSRAVKSAVTLQVAVVAVSKVLYSRKISARNSIRAPKKIRESPKHLSPPKILIRLVSTTTKLQF